MVTQEWNSILMTVIFSLPVVAAITCAMIVVLYSFETGNTQHQLSRTLITALLTWAFVWGCLVCYIQWPILFIVFQTAFFYAMMLFQVLLYRIIYLITGTGKKEHFSKIHYIAPVLVPAILLIWSFFVPLDVQFHIVESRGQSMSGYEAYTILFTSKSAGLLLWSVIYNLLSFKRIILYRRVIGDYSADEGRSPVRWLRILLLFMFSVIQLPFIALGMGKAIFVSSLWMSFPIALVALELIILCYNIVSENYILITDTDEKPNAVPGKERRINREYFEHYIQTKKPYLNPKLRITDLAAQLHSNRTYVSNFINNEYGMNFSRFINQQRLKELDLLCLDENNKAASGIDLVIKAGFSTYKGYIRVKTTEDRMSMVKDL